MKRAWLLVALVALPRLLLFPFNENLHGDAIARTWLAHLWLQHPHVIGGFDQGAAQFGPLHIYLLALAEWAWPSLLHAGRVVSLLAGVATAWPLYQLTRRFFGVGAAEVAVFGLASWGFHVQSSTTSASEAVNLLFVLGALERLAAWFDAPSRAVAGLTAALLLNLACATRYDSWLLVPMLSLVVAWRTSSLAKLLWFGAASSCFGLAWLFGNYVDRGDALYAFRFIDDFHRAWVLSEQATWGATRYRLLCLFFWPGTAVLSLSPFVALAGIAGLVRASREPRTRWLVVVVVVPAFLYTFRAVAFSSFAPLARFTVKEVALLLVFCGAGLPTWLSRSSRVLGGLTVAWTVGLTAFCLSAETGWPRTLSPLAASSRVDATTRGVCEWLAAQPDRSQLLVVDTDPSGYRDLEVSYFSGFAYEQQARRRSPVFEPRLLSGRPGYVVRFEGGALERDGRARLSELGLEWQREVFHEVSGFAPPVHVYVRAQAADEGAKF